ncbi:MAG: hypothetical protein H8D23_34145 [Candidatus Brocadiales bacterium]|nr:hypothetical protein [Candidatus Brocadiales bacterium]
MNDSEVREIVLRVFYEKRAENFIPINEKNFGDQFPISEIYRICSQLEDLEYIYFKAEYADNKIYSARGKILVSGTDYVEQICSETDKSNSVSSAATQNEYFVDKDRITELRAITSQTFDLAKLIRLSDELNVCYANECYMAVTMLARTVLDHVPPIFGYTKFEEVANNYQGKSFKKSMLNLQNSLRNIADAYLHLPIRKKETLPNKTQVNFANDFDVLLAEIVRVLK